MTKGDFVKQSSLLALLAIFSVQVNANTLVNKSKTNEQIICEKLNAKAEENCSEAMNTDARNGSIKETDFYEGQLFCIDEELSSLLKDFNKNHAHMKFSCDE
jgi:hypothetical protein